MHFRQNFYAQIIWFNWERREDPEIREALRWAISRLKVARKVEAG